MTMDSPVTIRFYWLFLFGTATLMLIGRWLDLRRLVRELVQVVLKQEMEIADLERRCELKSPALGKMDCPTPREPLA